MLKRILVGLFFLLSASFAWAVQPLTPSRYLNVEGVRIAVYESKGLLKPKGSILFLHGNSSSANAFAKILRSPIAKVYRMVAVDLPGFGKSDNAPNYNTAVFIKTIRAVAQATKTDNGVIVGWSLGGDLALQASRVLPKIKGYFLIGTSPVGLRPDLPPPFLSPQESYAGAAVNYGFVGALPPSFVDDYVTAFFRPSYRPIAPVYYTDGRRTDPKTRDAVAAGIVGMDPAFQDEVQLIKNLKVPVALIVGKQDAFVRISYLKALAPEIPTLWKDRVIVVPHTGHAVQIERPNVVLGLLTAFIAQL